MRISLPRMTARYTVGRPLTSMIYWNTAESRRTHSTTPPDLKAHIVLFPVPKSAREAFLHCYSTSK